MNRLKRKRHMFCPSVANTVLEQRQVLSSGSAGVLATPVPAPPPVSVAAMKAETAMIRVRYEKQFQAASTDLKMAVKADIKQLYASGTTPTAQQVTDFNASVAGAVDATALRLASQASLLPNSSSSLVPAIENTLLGSTATSLSSRLSALTATTKDNSSAGALKSSLMAQINRTSLQNIAQSNTYFSTTAVNRLSVDSSGQRIPLEEYMGGQLVSQLGNTFGSLAQTLPVFAAAELGTTSTSSVTPTPITPQVPNPYGYQLRGALSTAAYQLESSLAVLPGTSGVIQQIQPAVFGSATSTTSLAATLQNLSYGSSTFDSDIASAFGTAYQDVATPILSYLRMTTPSSFSLPTSGFTSPFLSQYTASTFNSGFNNGFATGTSTGFIGLGTAPTTFDTNYGTSFNNLVSSAVATSGLLGTGGTVGGVPYQNR